MKVIAGVLMIIGVVSSDSYIIGSEKDMKTLWYETERQCLDDIIKIGNLYQKNLEENQDLIIFCKPIIDEDENLCLLSDEKCNK